MKILLTSYEVMNAALVGVMRQTQNIKRGRKDAHGASVENGWQLHIQGALGECAVAKALGLYWNGSIGDLEAGDVGKIQVRTCTRPEHRLILHPTDPPDSIYVLATGTNNEFSIDGYIIGRDGMKKKYWVTGTGRPAYFVPRDALYSIERLIQNIRSRAIIPKGKTYDTSNPLRRPRRDGTGA